MIVNDNDDDLDIAIFPYRIRVTSQRSRRVRLVRLSTQDNKYLPAVIFEAINHAGPVGPGPVGA